MEQSTAYTSTQKIFNRRLAIGIQVLVGRYGVYKERDLVENLLLEHNCEIPWTPIFQVAWRIISGVVLSCGGCLLLCVALWKTLFCVVFLNCLICFLQPRVPTLSLSALMKYCHNAVLLCRRKFWRNEAITTLGSLNYVRFSVPSSDMSSNIYGGSNSYSATVSNYSSRKVNGEPKIRKIYSSELSSNSFLSNFSSIFAQPPCFCLSVNVGKLDPSIVQCFHLNSLCWLFFSTTWESKAFRWNLFLSCLLSLTLKSFGKFIAIYKDITSTTDILEFFFSSAFSDKCSIQFFCKPVFVVLLVAFSIQIYCFAQWILRCALDQPNFVQEKRLWTRGSHIGCFASEEEACTLNREASSNLVKLFSSENSLSSVSGQPVDVSKNRCRVAWYISCFPSLYSVPEDCHTESFALNIEKNAVREGFHAVSPPFGTWFSLSFPQNCEVFRPPCRSIYESGSKSTKQKCCIASQVAQSLYYPFEKISPPIYTNIQYPFRCDPPFVGDTRIQGIASSKVPVSCYLCCFQTSWFTTSSMKKPIVSLIIHGCGPAMFVFLNGHYVGYSTDGFLPCEFVVTPYLYWPIKSCFSNDELATSQRRNCLVLVCPKWCATSYLEDQDQWWLSGCFRDVELLRWPIGRESEPDAFPLLQRNKMSGFSSPRTTEEENHNSTKSSEEVRVEHSASVCPIFSKADLITVRMLCIEDLIVTTHFEDASALHHAKCGFVHISIRFGCELEACGRLSTLTNAIALHKKQDLKNTNWLSRFGYRVRIFYCGCPAKKIRPQLRSSHLWDQTSLGYSILDEPYNIESTDFSDYCVEDLDVTWDFLENSIEIERSKIISLSVCSAAVESPTSFSTSITLPLKNLKLWSDESPYLYMVCVSLVYLDDNDDVGSSQYRHVQCEALLTAFRDVRIKSGELLVNNRCVLFKGVNRHEHHPLRGKATPYASVLDDILLLKQFNFNAIRTSHYANTPLFYHLCDIFGFYVVNEANIESHGDVLMGWSNLLSLFFSRVPLFPLNRLANDPDWRLQWLLRIYRMVHRDESHPCVIIWSLGNEAGVGRWPREAKKGLRYLMENSFPCRLRRPVQYEPGHSPRDISDIMCPMYPPISELENFVNQKKSAIYFFWNRLFWFSRPLPIRPVILCEYQHAMGNSNGDLHNYWKIFEKISFIQGGFIWDLADQGLLQSRTVRHNQSDTAQPVEETYYYWAYGGDFSDLSTDKNFNHNGLLYADRRLKPGIIEAKFVYQPVHIRVESVSFLSVQGKSLDSFSLIRRNSSDISNTLFRINQIRTVDSNHAVCPYLVLKIFNKQLFDYLQDFDFHFVATDLDNPSLRAEGKLHVPSNIAPTTSGIACLTLFELPLNHSKRCLSLLIVVRLQRTLLWAKTGHIVAREQLWIKIPDMPNPNISGRVSKRRSISENRLSLRFRRLPYSQSPFLNLPLGHPSNWAPHQLRLRKTTDEKGTLSWFIRDFPKISSQCSCCERKKLISDIAKTFSSELLEKIPLSHPLVLSPRQHLNMDPCLKKFQHFELQHVNHDFSIVINCFSGVIEAVLREEKRNTPESSLAFNDKLYSPNNNNNILKAAPRKTLICGPIQYNFFRPPTDNDHGGVDIQASLLSGIRSVGLISVLLGVAFWGYKRKTNVFSHISLWRRAGLDRMVSQLIRLELFPETAYLEGFAHADCVKIVLEQHHGPLFIPSRLQRCLSILKNWLSGISFISSKFPTFNVQRQNPDTARIQPFFRSVTTYYLYPNGQLKICPTITPLNLDCAKKLPPLPRIGLSFCLPTSHRNVTYNGLGPHENYCDRRSSAIKGIFTSSVDAMYEPYSVPSEYGNRGDIEWISVTEPDTLAHASGFLIQKVEKTAPGMECSVQPFTVAQLDEATHQHDLKISIKPRAPYTLFETNVLSNQRVSHKRNTKVFGHKEIGTTVHLNVDFRHMGVGGECSWLPCVSDTALILPRILKKGQHGTSYTLPVWGCEILATPLKHQEVQLTYTS